MFTPTNKLVFSTTYCLCLISTQIRKRGLCAYDDKRYLLADGISTLAFGHRAIPATIREVQETRGFDQVVLTAAEARTRQIPLSKQRQLPAGQEPGECVNEARRVAIASIAPAATSTAATSSTAAATSSAAPSSTAPAAPLHVILLDPDGPHALSQDDLIRFILEED